MESYLVQLLEGLNIKTLYVNLGISWENDPLTGSTGLPGQLWETEQKHKSKLILLLVTFIQKMIIYPYGHMKMWRTAIQLVTEFITASFEYCLNLYLAEWHWLLRDCHPVKYDFKSFVPAP